MTIGTVQPFDRLVRAVDSWAATHPDEEVVAQIGDKGMYEPRNMRWMRMLTPQDFAGLVEQCRLLIAHAGTGSFFLAAEKARPIVLFPRRAALREHTTDHQVDTCAWLREKKGVYVALTEEELPVAIESALENSNVVVETVSPYAPEPFLAKLREAMLS